MTFTISEIGVLSLDGQDYQLSFLDGQLTSESLIYAPFGTIHGQLRLSYDETKEAIHLDPQGIGFSTSGMTEDEIAEIARRTENARSYYRILVPQESTPTEDVLEEQVQPSSTPATVETKSAAPPLRLDLSESEIAGRGLGDR